MRIISGSLGGRVFSSPAGHVTHPMSEKARGAIFNALGDIAGFDMLDVFGGSGAISFEAVSRGAKHVTVIESSRQAQRAIKENLSLLGVQEKISLVGTKAMTWLNNNSAVKFGIIIADPPFNDLQTNTLDALANHLTKEGVYVLSWPGNKEVPRFKGLQIAKNKIYGDSQLVFYIDVG